jgi:methionine synthase I (cobalamin-dependent)
VDAGATILKLVKGIFGARRVLFGVDCEAGAVHLRRSVKYPATLARPVLAQYH